jgi:PleD family two-component response regulator
VDDYAIIRDIIKSALAGDYRILEASNYSDVTKHLDYHIDLVIIDYILPDQNGFAVLKILRGGE